MPKKGEKVKTTDVPKPKDEKLVENVKQKSNQAKKIIQQNLVIDYNNRPFTRSMKAKMIEEFGKYPVSPKNLITKNPKDKGIKTRCEKPIKKKTEKKKCS